VRTGLLNLLLVLALSACGSKAPEITGIDLDRWKEDKNGCGGYRGATEPELRRQADRLKALNEAEVIRLLGRPDRNELYARNQKFFQYHVLPARTCSADIPRDSLRLVLRFNAVGLVREVTFE
jgi:hypothetical protein